MEGWTDTLQSERAFISSFDSSLFLILHLMHYKLQGNEKYYKKLFERNVIWELLEQFETSSSRDGCLSKPVFQQTLQNLKWNTFGNNSLHIYIKLFRQTLIMWGGLTSCKEIIFLEASE